MTKLTRYVFPLGCLLASIAFTYYYFLYTNEYPPGSYQKIANYEADKVFQTRLLITSIANFLEPTLPLLKSSFQWVVPYPIDYEVVLQLINVFFLGTLLFLIRPLAQVLGFEIPLLSSFLILVPLAWNYIFVNGFIDGAGLYYPYDIPSLTFFTVGIILFLQKKWIWFYPVFILACLNRESACFITLGGFILTFQIGESKFVDILKSNRRMISQVIAQAGIWLALRLILSYAFRNNPGEFFEQPHSMFDFIAKIGSGEAHWAMNNPRWFLTLFAGVWVVPFLYWKILNSSAKRFLLLGLIYLVVLIFRSNMMETRVFNELNVIVTVCALCAFSPKLTSETPSSPKWLIIQRDYGQLGNRLHTHANALAWCLENKVNLINLSFKKYSQLFALDKSHTVETFIARKSKLAHLLHFERVWQVLDKMTRSDKWLNRLTKIKVREKDDCDAFSESELDNSFNSENKTDAMLVRAWDLRFPNSLKKHQAKVRKILSPNEKAKLSADKTISLLREKYDCVVGVHARRGDYKEYLGGIHFHSWDSYRNWIIQTKNLMEGTGKKRVGFLLCSDDDATPSFFADLPVHFMGEKSVMTDLHALSLCDYNVGPPSSFGTWLSWYGKVPRHILQKGLPIQSASQFVICSHC